MNTKNMITRTSIVFAALAVAGIGMAVGARTLTDGFDQSVLVAVGSAMFGAALAFLLVRVFSLLEK